MGDESEERPQQAPDRDSQGDRPGGDVKLRLQELLEHGGMITGVSGGWDGLTYTAR